MRKAAVAILLVTAPLLFALVVIRQFSGLDPLGGNDLVIMLGSAPDFSWMTRNSLEFAHRVLSFVDMNKFWEGIQENLSQIGEGDTPFGAIPVPDIAGFKEFVTGLNMLLNLVASAFQFIEAIVGYAGSLFVGVGALLAAGLCFLFEPVAIAFWFVNNIIFGTPPVAA